MIIGCSSCTYLCPMTGKYLDAPPPGEQTNPTRQPCPVCKKDMWVSDLKREIIKKNPEISIMCFPCAIIEYKGQPGGLGDVEVVNLKKLN